MFQMMIMSELPKAAEKPPLLLLLISLFTVYIGVAIIFQGICIFLVDKTKSDTAKKPSPAIQKLTIQIAKMIAPSYLKPVNINKNRGKSNSENETLVDVANAIKLIGKQFYLSEADESFAALGYERIFNGGVWKREEADWILVAKVIDKIGFIIFITLLIGTVLALLVFVPMGNNWGMDY